MTRFRDVIEFVLFYGLNIEDEIHFPFNCPNFLQLKTPFLIK